MHSEEAVSPLFLKKTKYKEDNEFRIIYIKDSLWKSSSEGMYLPDNIAPAIYLDIGEPQEFISYIAVKDTSAFTDIAAYNGLNIQESNKMNMDGFKIYETVR